MTREKFPEKIPFRLTRMLTNAMEVSGSWVHTDLTIQTCLLRVQQSPGCRVPITVLGVAFEGQHYMTCLYWPGSVPV